MIPANRLVPLRPDPATSTSDRVSSMRGSLEARRRQVVTITRNSHSAPSARLAWSGVPARFAAHVQSHTVVLPRQRVLFLPMPKAACTSLLWTLAELAGMTPEDFENSTLPEPSAALTVHDMNAWAPDHRLAQYEGEDRRGVPGGRGWPGLTGGRGPWPRLWSGGL